MKVPFLINILNDKAQQYHCSKHQNSETQDDNLFHLFIDITHIPVTCIFPFYGRLGGGVSRQLRENVGTFYISENENTPPYP
ncbi:hypothetical protein FLL59_06695, partial [Vibrio cholerae]